MGPESALALVQQCLPGIQVRHATEAAVVDAWLPSTDVILDAYMRVPLTAERLGLAPRLKAVVTATTGASHIDTAALAARSIPLMTLAGQRALLRDVTAAAEHSWLLVLACARQLTAAVDHARQSLWDRNLFPGLMLRGRTLGLIGCGRIGEWMSRYATAFGMRVVGFDPQADPWPDTIERATLDEVLATADIVSVHVPLTDSTKGMLGVREFACMRPGAMLVNTSRGEVLDEHALVDALKRGHVAACGADVVWNEPDVTQSPLWRFSVDHPNVIITPHIGGFSPDAVAHVLRFSCERVRTVCAEAI